MRIDGNTPIDALYHSDEELSHAWFSKGKKAEKHKYIKREWRNGRWQYTYENDTSAKPSTTRVYGGKTKELFDSKTSYAFSNRKDVVKKEGRLSRYVKDLKKDWYASERRGTEKAAKEARSKGADLVDTDAKGSTMRTISIGNEVVSKTYRRGTIEKYVDTAKEFLKDKLGFDEKENYESARKEVSAAELRKAASVHNLNNGYKYGDSEQIREANKAFSKYKTELAEAEQKVRDARSNFAATPMGKITIVAEEGAKWLSSLFNRDTPKKTVNTAVGDNDSDYIRDLQSNNKWKVESTADKVVTKADKAVKKAEEGLDLAKKRENYTKNQQTKLQEQLSSAKVAADKGKERWEKAKKDYEESSKVDYELFKKALDQKDALNKMTDGPGKEAAQKAYDKIYNEWLNAYNESARLQNVRDREYNAYQQLKQAITQVEDRIEKEKTLPDSAAKNRRDAEYEQELAKTLKEYEEELEKLRKK